MIITVLEQKYKVGCGRGIAMIEKPHVLSHLNMIIEWSKCIWPEKEEDVEVETLEGEKELKKIKTANDKFLGDEPELKPGNCFLLGGQVIAVDSEDRLVLIVSETGPGALNRVYEDLIEPEIDMIFNTYQVDVLGWEKSKKSQIPENYEPVSIPYNVYKIWKDKFLVKEGIADSDDLCIKVEVESSDLFMPVVIYFLKWNVFVSLDDYMDKDHVKDIVKQAVSWFYERC